VRISTRALFFALLGACSPAPDRSLQTAGSLAPLPARSTAKTPPAPPPRYAIATCPLRYEVRTSDTSRMDGAPGAVALDAFIALDARPSGAVLELVGHVSMQPVTGTHRSFDVPVESYAPVRLETDGARWIERDGPTQLYDSMGSLDGLVWFFPELPRAGDAGAIGEWTISHPDPDDVAAAEAARGDAPGSQRASAPPSKAKAIAPTRLQVRLDRWTEVAGARVAELSMTGAEDVSQELDLLGPATIVAKRTFRGAYAVTEAGLVLRATVEKDVDLTMTSTFDGKTTTQHHVQHGSHRMNLVAACTGPTAPSLATPLDREERAIRAWGETWLAVTKGEREKALAGFDPSLRKKIGDAKLWDALESYRKLRGDHALPPPLLLKDNDIHADSAGVRITAHGSTPEPSKALNHQVECEVSLHEEGGGWVVDAVSARLVLEKQQNLLEITREHAIVRKGWPPR